jgi:lactoylglutathione lyase
MDEDEDVEPTLRIEIFPADLERTVSFYESLGFQVVGRVDGPLTYASLRFGGVRIGAAEAPAVDPNRRAYPVGTEIVIEVDDVRSERDRIVAAGIELLDDLQERPWGLVDFRLSDPDGYYYRFTSRT